MSNNDSNKTDSLFPRADKFCWYIVQVHTSFENSVIKSIKDEIARNQLEEYFEEFYFPHVSEKDTKAKKVKSMPGYMPGYIFVRMKLNSQTFAIFRGINRLVGFAGSYSSNKVAPKPISDKEYEQIKENIAAIESKKNIKGEDLKIGSQVKIKEGSFVSLTGIVDSFDEDKKRVKVLIKIFERETAVELDWSQVELIEQ